MGYGRRKAWRAVWLCSSALAGLALVQPARADQSWIGATSTDWFDGTNWNGGAAPAAKDNVTIDTTLPNATVIGGGGAANAQDLTVGQDATGKLAITGGSTLTLSGLTYLGGNLESSGTLTIDGAGSSLSTVNNVYVGYGGNGTLALSNGASLSGHYLLVGNNPASAGWLTVDGAGSTINLLNDLHVGISGTGTLAVTNGGVINSSQLILGTNAGGDGTATVDGAGSQINPFTYIVVGSGGTGTLNITNGGQVSGGYFYGTSIGDQSGSTGTVTVSGTGSKLQTGQLTIGNNGTGTLNVSHGGQASAGIISLGNNAGASGTLAITAGGQAAAGQMYVGYGGTGTLTVDGAGSTLEVASSLAVGYFATGTLRISNGGQVLAATASPATITVGYGASGAIAIDGPGSTFGFAGSTLYLGYGSAGTMAITNGGTATIGNATLGTNGTLTVDGAGSLFTADTLTMGFFGGSTSTLTVSNGGTVTTANAITVAAAAGSTGTIVIGAAEGQAPVAPGTINAPGISFGDGTGALVFNHTSSNYVFDVPLTGAGDVRVDAGTTVMTTTQGYTGFTTINGGQLIVTGDISSSAAVLVQSAGTLSGTGRVPFTLLDTGTLAPGVGTATGTLTINDRVMFCACSTYAVKVSASGSDLVQVVPGGFSNGDAFLAGTVKVSSPTASYRFGTPYTILTAAGGLNDTTFDSLVLPSTHISGALSYTATDVLLTLTSQLSRITGLNRNQQAVANAIDTGLNAGGSTGGFGGFFTGTPGNFTQASGEVATGAQQTTFNAMGQFLGALLDPRSGGVETSTPGAPAFAAEPGVNSTTSTGRAQNARDALAMVGKAPPRDPFAARWNVWASGFGGAQTTDGNAATGSNTATSRIAGAAVGADYFLSPHTIAGFALAGGGTSFSVANNGGTGRSDLFQAGAFIRHTIGATYLSGALAYGWQDVTTDRTLGISGVDRLQARFNANAWSGRLEGGTRIATPWFGLTPYAALQATVFDLPAYAEQALAGSGALALRYASRSATDTRAELGLRADRSWALNDAILTLRGRAAWAHDFNPDRTVAATFQSLPGSSFVVNGAAQAQNAALTTASAEVRWLNGFSVAASFEGEFSEISRSYGGRGTVRYQW